MLKQVFDLIRQVFLLNERTNRNQEGLSDLQGKVMSLSQSTDRNFQEAYGLIERLVYEVRRLEVELKHSREREADARERLRLELENKILKEKRQLPPAARDKNDTEDE